jgi:excinuclease ABC subunit A
LLRRVLLPGLQARRGGSVVVEGRPGIQRAAVLGRLERDTGKNLLAHLGIFAGVAALYAEASSAREQQYTKEWFMFDRPGGRCPTCEGAGVLRCDLEFCDDVSMRCPACEGRRYRPEALAITWRGLTLAQVLELTVAAAAHHFRGIPQVGEILQVVLGCGLGHRQLGEAGSRLGPGEGLRLALAGELRRAGARELVVLEQPEAAAHPRDLLQLLQILDTLSERGTSVLVETHHPTLIGAADWVVEVYPGQRVRSGAGASA